MSAHGLPCFFYLQPAHTATMLLHMDEQSATLGVAMGFQPCNR